MGFRRRWSFCLQALGPDRPGCESWFSHLPVCGLGHYPTFLCLSFLISKVGVILSIYRIVMRIKWDEICYKISTTLSICEYSIICYHHRHHHHFLLSCWAFSVLFTHLSLRFYTISLDFPWILATTHTLFATRKYGFLDCFFTKKMDPLQCFYQNKGRCRDVLMLLLSFHC